MAEPSVRNGRVGREGGAELHPFSSVVVYLVKRVALLQMSRDVGTSLFSFDRRDAKFVYQARNLKVRLLMCQWLPTLCCLPSCCHS